MECGTEAIVLPGPCSVEEKQDIGARCSDGFDHNMSDSILQKNIRTEFTDCTVISGPQNPNRDGLYDGSGHER